MEVIQETTSTVNAPPGSGETLNTRTRRSKASSNLPLSSMSNLPTTPKVSVAAMKPSKKSARKGEMVTNDDIEEIVARKRVNGSFQYLVKWPGSGVRANSWIPKENFQSSAVLAGFDQMMEEELVQNVTETVPDVMLEDSEHTEPTPLQEITDEVRGGSDENAAQSAEKLSPPAEPEAPVLTQKALEESEKASCETATIAITPTDEVDRAVPQARRKKSRENPGCKDFLHSSRQSTPLASSAAKRCLAEASLSPANGKKFRKIVRKQASAPIISSSQVEISPIRRTPSRANLTNVKGTESKGLTDPENQTEGSASSEENSETTMSFEKPASTSNMQICLSFSIEGSPQSIPGELLTCLSSSEPEEDHPTDDQNQTIQSSTDITMSASQEDSSNAPLSEISVVKETPKPRLFNKTTITKMFSPIEEYERRRSGLTMVGKSEMVESSLVPNRTSKMATKRKTSAGNHPPRKLTRSGNSTPRRSSHRSCSAGKSPNHVATRSSSGHPPDSDEDDEPRYVVEEILDMKYENGLPLYYVKWRDYPHSQNEWLEKELFDSLDIVENFERSRSSGTKTKNNSSRGRGRTPKRTFELSLSVNDFEQQDSNEHTQASSKITPNKKQNKRKSLSEPPQTQSASTSASKLKKSKSIYSDKNTYNVEKILAMELRDGKKIYLVKWENYSSKHNSWIGEENFLDPSLVEEFELGNEASTSKPSKLSSSLVQKTVEKKRSLSAKTQSKSLPNENSSGIESQGESSNGTDQVENRNKSYVVEKILEKVVEGGITYYFVKWEEYDSSYNEWIQEDLFDCLDMVNEFNQKLAQKSSTSKTENLRGGQTVYIVEKILGKRKVKGVVEYLCKWEGYSYEHNSWTARSLLDCDILIEEFEERQRNRMLGRSNSNNVSSSSSTPSTSSDVSSHQSYPSRPGPSRKEIPKSSTLSVSTCKIPVPKEALPKMITGQGFSGMAVFYNVMYEGETEPRIVSSEKANKEFPLLVMTYHKRLLSSLSPGDD